MNILIDNREQSPWHFPEHVATVYWGTINAGDYAIKGDEQNFAIERKSLDDFIGTISSGWTRFQNELERMKQRQFPARIIIVEGDYESCCFRSNGDELIPPDHNHPKILPQFVQKRIAELTMIQVHVLFAGDPVLAAALAYSILKERYKTIPKQDTNHADRNHRNSEASPIS